MSIKIKSENCKDALNSVKGPIDPGEEIRDIGWQNVSYESFEPCELKGLALLYAVLECMKDRFAFDYTKPLFPNDRSGIIVIEGGVRTLIPLSHVEGLFRVDSFYDELNKGVGDWKIRVDGPLGLAYSVVHTGRRELFEHVETGKTGLEALAKMFVTCRMGYPVLIPKSLLEVGLGNEDPSYQFQSDNSDTPEGTTREPELRDYHLSWEIELSAANPKDAARIAADYQREMLPMFGVTDLETGVTTLVDLEEGTEAVENSWNIESVLEEPVAIGVAQTLVNEVHRLNKLNHGASLHVLLKASLENIAETYELTPAIEYEWANLKR